jgi:AcrR family transcriptional regulator
VVTQQPARIRAPRLDPDARRASILDAATELFAERGQGFTTADLARAAGVSEGTIFRYFPDKAALLDATRDAALGLETLIPQIQAACALPTLTQRLVAAGHALSPRLERTGRVLENLEHHEHPGGDVLRDLLSAMAPLFADEVVSGVEAEQLAGVFLGTMLANTLLCTKAGLDAIDIDRLVDLVLHGISGRTPT